MITKKYIMSDIHGDYDRWRKMLEKIHFSDDDLLIVLGDAIDRGPDGIKILKEIMEMENVRFVWGNHELLMLYALYADRKKFPNRQDYINDWMNNGGYPTSQAFFKETEESQNKIIKFIQSSKFRARVRLDDGRIYSIVHGWLYNGENENTELYHSVWDRPDKGRMSIPIEHDGMLIIGHTRTDTIDIHVDGHPRILHAPHFIDIDCGNSHHGGCLGCLCLNNLREYYVL